MNAYGFSDPSPAHGPAARAALASLRILLAWTFIWPFLDKMFGFGFSTASKAAVIHGGSPTKGFLLHGTKGPCAHLFDSVAGSAVLDAVFMCALLGIGLAFLFGIGLRVAATSCALMTAFMWLVTLQPADNPITDEHWMLAIAGAVIVTTRAGDYFGYGRAWRSLPLVRRSPWLV